MNSIEVAGTFNVRAVAGPGLIPHTLFRSAALDHLDSGGRDMLCAYGIRTVIDLRDATERAAADTTGDWTVAHHPLYDPRTGPPQAGDIAEVYRALLDERGGALVEALRGLACSPAPVLVHCTAGKDRTGLLVALALAAVGVPDAVILDDYARSGTQVRPHREEAVRRLLTGLALDPAEHARALELHLDSPPSVLGDALADLRARHGTVTSYLRAHGFTDADLTALRTRLLDATTLTVLHLSDVHASASARLRTRVDGIARVRLVAERVESSTLRPDVVVVTGDLSHHGESSTYPALATAFDELRVRLGCPVVVVPGNHDEPHSFATFFGRNPVEHVHGFRVIGLNTAVGSVSRVDLDLLRSELRSPAANGTVLALHHPPVPSPAATLTGRELAAPEELAAALDGSDVVAILAGHFHHPMSGVFAGIPVWVGGSLAYLQDTGTPADTVVGFDAPMYSVVRCSRHGVSALPIPLHTPDVLFRSSPTLTAAS
ncbi:tyrosine-protein phosphatase [Rhodococcus opacus]|uniref:tyrosine-protein phosphatase n=1 Tax=Rhodococcus opacus TaxID=37919 RepID=UPI001C49220C|nr:tyrosine-protein phosphatase [Rhodococcus opacus]MBV6756917.1 tyrosine-protein phosphatase [Rhodococcus opacus]